MSNRPDWVGHGLLLAAIVVAVFSAFVWWKSVKGETPDFVQERVVP